MSQLQTKTSTEITSDISTETTSENPTEIAKKIPTNSWVTGSWDEFISIIEKSIYDKAKCYYYQGEFRLEMSPTGYSHSQDHHLITYGIDTFAAINKIPFNGHENCSYRKKESYEIQPDISYHIGDQADAIPWATTVVNLEEYPVPNLVIEIANTSLSDDLGKKRLIYEELGIDEYWIVDVKNAKIIAFAIENIGNNIGSKRITQSQVLAGLNLSILEEALQKSRQTNHSEIIMWLLKQFQS